MRLTELVTPLKPLEAMAQGQLFVASDVGGHRELVRDGENGRLFRAGDQDALVRTVLELLGDPEAWPRLRNAGRRYVEAERTWEASVARYAPVYERLKAQAERRSAHA
jgi:glycosyltransferase involved in cell wall biosynthesis